MFYNISFVDIYIGKIEFFFSNLVLGTPCKIFIIKWMFSCHLQCKRSVKFFTVESFNQTRKRRHSEFYCYKKLFVWKRVVNKSSLWRLKNEQQSVWTGTYISLLFNRFKMFHMKWVKEGKKMYFNSLSVRSWWSYEIWGHWRTKFTIQNCYLITKKKVSTSIDICYCFPFHVLW